MRSENNVLLLSSTDLASHLGCGHLTQLNRKAALGECEAPAWQDPSLKWLQERGIEHEEAYVLSLQEQGLTVERMNDGQDYPPVEKTLDAMERGVDIIVQAGLRNGRWRGWADILRRVDTPSKLGDWSYEVIDTKLALNTRGGTILQLCLYCDLIESLQGVAPKQMHVVKPGPGFPTDSYRFATFRAYYNHVRDKLKQAVDLKQALPTYPEPVPHCDICRWWLKCDKQRHDDDHLSLVAGMQRPHREELKRHSIVSLEQFAMRDTPLPEPPQRGHIRTYENLHRQAGVQLRGREDNKLRYEYRDPEEGRGLRLLPAPSPGDIFFDIESDQFFDGGGIEYLFGCTFANGDYLRTWALDRSQEKAEFEALMDRFIASWDADPGMHIYHFSPYEPAAMKRLAERYGTRETALDRLLRGSRFVDLLAVARQGMWASVESYSLKELEQFAGFKRDADLRNATAARRRVACLLEQSRKDDIEAEDRDLIEQYNKEDCLATAALRDWLEDRRTELIGQGQQLDRPPPGDGEPSENVEQREAAVQAVFDQLVAKLPEDRNAWDADQQATWLLANLLNYFRREERVAWWEFFRLGDLPPDDLYDEREAIAGLKFEVIIEPTGQQHRPAHRYSFQPQECNLKAGDQLSIPGGQKIGVVRDVDVNAGIIDILQGADDDAQALRPEAVVTKKVVLAKPLDTSLLGLGQKIASEGLDGVRYRAAADLLRRRPPRLLSPVHGALRGDDEDVLDAAKRIVADLDESVLSIQGPPGAGKTHTAAHMILALLQAGKKVGVTAVSHKVIRNLLKKTIEEGRRLDLNIKVVHKGSADDDSADYMDHENNNSRALERLTDGELLGGTAWLWARDEAEGLADYLFVDEAGQMSLAFVLAISRATKNLVLVGDPQQLDQPQKADHPEGSGVAALEHMLNGVATIPPERGLFLDRTWRLHPTICRFTSEQYYEERLEAREANDRQRLLGTDLGADYGLFYLPVEHTGNQNKSVEEIEATAALVKQCTGEGRYWFDVDGNKLPLTLDDVLVVAPYNAQVAALTARIPAGRVGTVDKFQGQEAPIVIYSMASSSAADAPRGMRFLYDPCRLNVASSRARCACILVGAPALFEPECVSPEQMRWANGLCRFRELATEITLNT